MVSLRLGLACAALLVGSQVTAQEVGAGELSIDAFRRVCRALCQPMSFRIVRTCLVSDARPGVEARARNLLDEHGLLQCRDAAHALELLKSDATPLWSIAATTVLTAAPLHYEEVLDASGQYVESTLLSDGLLDVTKVQHSRDRAQYSVVSRKATERFATPWLVSPIPLRQDFLEEWFRDWVWSEGGSASAKGSVLIAERDGYDARYQVGLEKGGLPCYCGRWGEDKTSGSIAFFSWSQPSASPLWLHSVLVVRWSPGQLDVYQSDLSDVVPITVPDVLAKRITVSPGDLVVDGRVVPRSVVRVEGRQSLVGLPYIQFVPRGAGGRRIK